MQHCAGCHEALSFSCAANAFSEAIVKLSAEWDYKSDTQQSSGQFELSGIFHEQTPIISHWWVLCWVRCFLNGDQRNKHRRVKTDIIL